MGYQIIMDKDYLLEVSKKINTTSSEITSSIASLQKTCDDLVTNNQNQNLVNFKNNFDEYLIKLSNVVLFYNNISNNIKDMIKEYDEVDNNDSSDLKSYFDKESGI